MNIVLNNRSEHIDGDVISIQHLLEVKNFTFKMLVIKINGKLIRKNEYAKAMVNNGDNVTVLHLVSGG